jgi:hypothetical protein
MAETRRRYCPLIGERQAAGREQPKEMDMRKIVELKKQEIENVVGGVLATAALSMTSTSFQSPLNAPTSTTVATSGGFQTWSPVAPIKRL